MIWRPHGVPFFALLLVLAASTACSTVPDAGIPFELGAAEFHGGDRIVIEHVQSTTGGFAPGSLVTIRGSYHLASRDAGTLYFGTTTNDPAYSQQPEPEAQEKVTRGSGTFALQHRIPAAGHLHVTLYDLDSGQPFGGQYFGRDDSLLVTKAWAYAR